MLWGFSHKIIKATINVALFYFLLKSKIFYRLQNGHYLDLQVNVKYLSKRISSINTIFNNILNTHLMLLVLHSVGLSSGLLKNLVVGIQNI